ncbi:MAG: serine/threonine protein kinase [Myxococcales bacterium]|nr:serine/threonine protein kinase [Myxococcales bacterium]MCB9578276.1 serine/threonine protein kinase [Polyangiaceae bacterium]
MSAPTVSRIGRYEIVGLLATGGMAEILLGRLVGPSGFERPVVVKRILPHLARVSTFVDMFVDEARIVAGIRHPNVVAVQELAHEGDELFLVMEYLEGESLGGVARRLVTHKETLDRALSAFVIAEACAGLHAAHELKDEDGMPRDLVHRDVSPQNVFVTYGGQVKLLDFGIAKAANRSTRTEAGQVKGKFAYMSPEQCLGKPLDRRSDIFALGIVLWELSTGRRLFKRGSEHLTFKAICDERILKPSEVVPDYPPVLENVVMKALSRRRDDRYQTAQEMRRELLSAARQLGTTELPEEQLSAVMHRVFAERIEEKEDMLRRFHVGSAPTKIPVAEADEDVDLPSVVEDLSTIHTSTDVAASTPKPAPRRFLAPLVAAALAAGVAVFVVGRQVSNAPAPEPAVSLPAPVASAPPPPAASSAAPAEAATVVLRIETTPSGARVSIPGSPPTTTPAELAVPKSGEAITIELTRPGYSPRKEQVVPNMSQRLVLPLTPLPRTGPAKPQEIPKFR